MYYYFFKIIIISLFAKIYVLSNEQHGQPKVKIEVGAVLGLYKKSFSGKVYRSFEGIPYALPLTNGNRFQESVLYTKNYELSYLNASDQAAPCLQYNQFMKDDGEYLTKGDEDCLLPRRPILINFNHGGFSQGGSNELSPDSDSLIVITFNYRLGPLGFISTGDSVVSGNMGLKDQVVLMQWVKSNIENFGGDNKKITLLGFSASAASVNYHMISPLSFEKGLFHRAISISGSALCPWALVSDVPEKTRKLSALVGCPTESSKLMIACLRERPAHIIVEQMKHFQVWLYNPFTVFGPRIETESENKFLHDSPINLLTKEESSNMTTVPWIASVTSEEGLYPGAEFVYDSKLLSHLEDNWRKIAPYLLFYNYSLPIESHDKIAESIKKEYMKESSFSIDSRIDLVKMLSDRLFKGPVVKSALLMAKKNKEPVYFYEYSQKNQVSVSKMLSNNDTVIGSAQGDDYSLIFKFKNFNNTLSEKDKKMGEILRNIIVTFTKTGETPKDLKWKKLPTDGKKLAYLNLVSPTDTKETENDNLGNNEILANIFKDEK